MKTLVLTLSLAALMVLFAVNRWWTYSNRQTDLPRLTAGHIVDPRSSGATFQFAGRVTSVRTTPNSILVIRLHDPEEDVYLDVPVFPSLGPLPVKPISGEVVRVTGNLGSYGGRPQLRPLSAPHVQVLKTQETGQAVPLAQAALRKGERLRVGPVQAVRVEPFTSRRGRNHVSLTFTDARLSRQETIQGIIFEGDRTYHEVGLLRSGAPVVVTANIDEYRGRPSLVVKRVVRAE